MIKLFALILFSIPSFLLAQQRKAFKIIGHTTFYNNKHLAIQGGVLSSSYKYNDFNFVNDKIDTAINSYKIVQVQNGQFTINGFQKYPHPFQVSYFDAENNTGSSSKLFFIDGGTVNIEINDLSTNKNLESLLNSKSNKEYQHLKKLYSNAVDTLTEEIHNFKAKQKTIQKYIIQNPNSYVALWDLVIDYAINKNYKNDDDIKIILKNAQLLSSTIKKTSTYQALVKSINQDLKLSSGKTFPNIQLDSIYRNLEMVEDKVFPNIPLNSIDSLIPIIKNNKFTLLDFWFSYCKPCIEQFPRYKTIYALNKSRRFEIIGISVDRKEDEANWQKTIQKYNLDWLQYLDRNEIITQKLNITSFPTNFLLDNDGKIIKKNISPDDLDIFLQKNLNF
jgi:thiol-disulfide isomerase/thioredoxin